MTFRYMTAGESHGPALTVIIEGLPAGLLISLEKINIELQRRQMGYGRGHRMEIEKDKIEVLSGIRFSKTLGSPLSLIIKNIDYSAWQNIMAPFGTPIRDKEVLVPRPGHCDLPGSLRFNTYDARNILERASARETAARVAAGAIAKQYLSGFGVEIASYVHSIGTVYLRKQLTFYEAVNLKSDLLMPKIYDKSARKNIEEARKNGYTLGGTFVVLARGVIAGIGSCMSAEERLDGAIGSAFFSIPAVKAVEIGNGILQSALPGNKAHDAIFYDKKSGFFRKTNNAGGIEGGMTNGEEILVKAFMKPLPTLMKPLPSINMITKKAEPATRERADVCAVSAASIIGESILATVLAKTYSDIFSGSTYKDILSAFKRYKKRIKDF